MFKNKVLITKDNSKSYCYLDVYVLHEEKVVLNSQIEAIPNKNLVLAWGKERFTVFPVGNDYAIYLKDWENFYIYFDKSMRSSI